MADTTVILDLDASQFERAAQKAADAFDGLTGDIEDGSKAAAKSLDVVDTGARELEASLKRAQKNAEEYTGRVDRLSRAHLEMATATGKVADAGGASAEALERVRNVAATYAVSLQQLGDNQSYLLNQWKRSLTPADETARKLAEVVSFATDAERQTLAYSLTVQGLSEKLERQIKAEADRAIALERTRQAQEATIQTAEALRKATEAGLTATTQATVATARQTETAAELTLILKQLAFDTSDAEKQSQEYRDTVAALQTRLAGLTLAESKAGLEARKQADAAEEVTRAYARQKQQLDSLETAMGALGVPGAGLVSRLREMSDSLETASEHGTGTQVALLKAGMAVGALAGAAAGAVAGVAAIGGALVAVVASADDWNKELVKVGLNLRQADLDRYAASVETVGLAAKAVGVQIASTMGPIVEQAATRVAALGLAAVDAWKNLGSGEQIMSRLARWAGEVLTEALFLPVTAVARLGEAFGELARWAGFDDMAAGAAEFGKIVEGWKVEQADGVTAALQMMARDAVAPLITVTDDYMARASALVRTHAATRDAAKAVAVATVEVAAAHEAARVAVEVLSYDPLTESAGRYVGTLEQIPVVSSEALKASMASFNAVTKASDEAAERGRQSWSSSFSSIGSSAGRLSEMLISYSQREGDAAHKAAVAVFRVQQASALVSVAISTSQAIMQALANLPPPASYVASGAALAAGLLQAATIAAQPAPSPAGGGASMPGGVGLSSAASTQTGQTSIVATRTGGSDAAEPVQVTDAYFGPSAGSQVIRTTPGDEATIERAGPRAQRDARMQASLDALLDGIDRQTQVLVALRSDLLYRAHVDGTRAPSRGY